MICCSFFCPDMAIHVVQAMLIQPFSHFTVMNYNWQLSWMHSTKKKENSHCRERLSDGNNGSFHPRLKGRTLASAYAAVSVILQCFRKKKKLTFSTESCVPEAAPKQVQLSDFFIGKSKVFGCGRKGERKQTFMWKNCHNHSLIWRSLCSSHCSPTFFQICCTATNYSI